MHSSITSAFLSALLASSALAASSSPTTAATSPSIVSVLFLQAPSGHPLIGSVVHSDASKTTLAVTCANSKCGLPSTVTATFGPSTFSAKLPYIAVTEDLKCSVYGTTESASCVGKITGASNNVGLSTGSATASDATGTTTVTRTTVYVGSQVAYYPITVVSDLGKAESSVSGSATASESASAASASSSNAAGGLDDRLLGSGVVAGLVGGIMAVL